MAKKYYWLKLREDFFDREEIRIIEQMENGKDYIIFYMKLLLRSVKTDGILRFKDILPYNPKMLSVITDTNIDIVRSAIDLFTHFGMMECWDDGTLFMVETINMIGSESGSAERMRRLRARKKEVCKIGQASHCDTSASQCDADVRKCDTDIDIDKDKEQQREHDGVDAVEIFFKYGINIRPVLKQNPDAFLCLGEEELEKIASTLKEKYNEGIITNPVGLLLHDLTGITKAILCGTFYPKKKKKSQNDYELYFYPAE